MDTPTKYEGTKVQDFPELQDLIHSNKVAECKVMLIHPEGQYLVSLQEFIRYIKNQ